jgi:hypothetical protein
MMCLAVVVMAVMSVVGGVSALATVEKLAMVAAEEVDNGQGDWRLCRVIYFSQLFFLNVIATATEDQCNHVVSSHEA